MIASQPDFMEQKTLLQHFCELLGAKSDHTPVAHCEIAGEGIEFDWGYSKTIYRSKPLSMKRNKTKFHELVDSVLGREVLTLAVSRANSRRARQYMLAYKVLAEAEHGQYQHTSTGTDATEKQNEDNKANIKVTHSLIEKCVSLFRRRRTHRNVIDFEGKYLKDTLLKNLVDGMSIIPKEEQK